MKIKTIAVGSKNPAKIEAVLNAFQTVWPEDHWVIEGYDVPSGVSDQPMSDQEAIRGAVERAGAALKMCDADFSVGVESGLQKVGSAHFGCGWIFIIDKTGKWGIGSSARVIIPEKMMDIVKTGKECGDATDILFGVENSKQNNGYFGLVSNDTVTRASAYTHGVIFALAPFLHEDLFEMKSGSTTIP